jgi:hypothetical protein
MRKLDLEKLFHENNVQLGDIFYSKFDGEVEYTGISRFLGTTLLNFKTKLGVNKEYTCNGCKYEVFYKSNEMILFPSRFENDWFKWAEKRKNGNKCEENLFQTENKIVYLVIKPENIMKELTIREWNDFIDRYTNDKNSVVEPYNENMDGYVFITTSLENILNNHSFNDLRFLVPEKTEYHITEFKLNK